MEREGEKGEEEMERWQTHSSNGIWSLDLLDAAADVCAYIRICA